MKANSYPLETQMDYEISLRPALEELSQLQAFIEQLAKEAPGSQNKLLAALRLIGHELFTNCLFHSGLDAIRDKIVFRGMLQEKGVLLECLDPGISFEPAKVPLPDFSGEQERGFGLYLIRQAADIISYYPKAQAGINVFRIEKYYDRY